MPNAPNGGFQVTVEVTERRVKDLLCCGLESGSYGSFVIVDYQPKGIDKDCEFPHLQVPFKENGIVAMKDKYVGGKVLHLNREALQRGLDVLSKNYPHHMAHFMEENEDVITGDSFLQCALLGDIIYG